MNQSSYFCSVAIFASTLALSISLAIPAWAETVTDTTGSSDSPSSTVGKQQTRLSSTAGATAVADKNATDSKATTKSPAHASKKIVKRGRKPSGYGEPGNVSTIPDAKTPR